MCIGVTKIRVGQVKQKNSNGWNFWETLRALQIICLLQKNSSIIKCVCVFVPKYVLYVLFLCCAYHQFIDWNYIGGKIRQFWEFFYWRNLLSWELAKYRSKNTKIFVKKENFTIIILDCKSLNPGGLIFSSGVRRPERFYQPNFLPTNAIKFDLTTDW